MSAINNEAVIPANQRKRRRTEPLRHTRSWCAACGARRDDKNDELFLVRERADVDFATPELPELERVERDAVERDALGRDVVERDVVERFVVERVGDLRPDDDGRFVDDERDVRLGVGLRGVMVDLRSSISRLRSSRADHERPKEARDLLHQ